MIRFIFLAFIFFSLPITVFAQDLPPISMQNSVALGGYDAVAYFAAEEATPGKGRYSLRHNKATWYFSSASNRHSFKDNPQKYAPQFGGYCATCLAKGQWVAGNPRFWMIKSGKLYVQDSLENHQKWQSDFSDLHEKALETWSQRFPDK